jgi:hypothetical protein
LGVIGEAVLDLESKRWRELEHAYGSAADTPALLAQLKSLPKSEGRAEPWFSLWSSLAHQGDVYSASFAAVPHVIAALAVRPAEADESFFQFPAWVEICRVKHAAVVPPDLEASYFDSLARLPELASAAASPPWSAGRLACVLSAIAAAKGHHAIAEAVLEMSSTEVAESFLERFSEQ